MYKINAQFDKIINKIILINHLAEAWRRSTLILIGKPLWSNMNLLFNRSWISVVYFWQCHLIMYQTILNIFLSCKILIKVFKQCIYVNESCNIELFIRAYNSSPLWGFTHDFSFIVICHELTPFNLFTIHAFCSVWSPENKTNKPCLCRIPEPKTHYGHFPLGQKKIHLQDWLTIPDWSW